MSITAYSSVKPVPHGAAEQPNYPSFVLGHRAGDMNLKAHSGHAAPAIVSRFRALAIYP
jgi:hypothetical protein